MTQARINNEIVQIRKQITDTIQNINLEKDDKQTVNYCKSLKVLIKKLEEFGYDVNIQVIQKRQVIS